MKVKAVTVFPWFLVFADVFVLSCNASDTTACTFVHAGVSTCVTGVPWISQYNPRPGTQSGTRNCGQTSAYMIWGLYHGMLDVNNSDPACTHCLTPDGIVENDTWLNTYSPFRDSLHNTSNGPNGEFTSGTRKDRLPTLAALKYGYTDSHYYEGWTPAQLQNELSSGHPVIVGVYTFMKKVRGHEHWMVLVGLDDDWAWVNDPGRSLKHEAQARYYAYKRKLFDNVWDGTVVVIHPAQPESGTINIVAQLDNSPWAGAVRYTLLGPGNFNTTQSALMSFQNQTLGSYSLAYNGGGPPNSSLSAIAPCGLQTRGPTACALPLTPAGLTFTLQFTSNPPTAGFKMSSGSQSAFDGNTLDLNASTGTVTVNFDAATRSGAVNGGSIVAWQWAINNVAADRTSSFSHAFSPGTYIVSLSVTDNRRATSSIVQGTVIVAAPSPPTWTKIGSLPFLVFSGDAVMFDPVKRVLLIFTFDSQTKRTAVWQWDRVNATKLSDGSGGPTYRAQGGTFAYDEGRHEVVLFGGIDGGSSGNILSDTWVWNGSVWIQKHPTSSPTARWDAVAAYDAATDYVVLYGGTGPGCQDVVTGWCSDTWVWDGSEWSQRMTSRQSYNLGLFASITRIVYDKARAKVTMFGGLSPIGLGATIPNCNVLNSTWTWDGSTWTKITPAVNPPARVSSLMTYDETRQQVVLFSGEGCGRTLNDTWTWDGENWTMQFPKTIPPYPGSLQGENIMTFDAVNGQVLIINPLDSSVWAWPQP